MAMVDLGVGSSSDPTNATPQAATRTDYLDQDHTEEGECLQCNREECTNLRERTGAFERQMAGGEAHPDPLLGYVQYTIAQRDLRAAIEAGQEMDPPCEVESEYENRPPSERLTDADEGLDYMQEVADEVNPEEGTRNCAKIIEAVDDRLSGVDPDAVAPTVERGSTWGAIEQRFDTKFQPSSYEDVFERVRAGGPGTRGLIGISYPNSNTAHVAMVTNQGGAVGIIEGQAGGRVILSPAGAASQYGSQSTIRYAPVE